MVVSMINTDIFDNAKYEKKKKTTPDKICT